MTTQAQAITPRRIVQMLIIVALFPLLPLIISGQWDWWEAWVYAVLSMAGFLISRALAARRTPDILQERARSMDLADAKAWDKVLAPMIALGSLFIPAVAGLDRLFVWSEPFSLPVKIIALIVILLGYVLGSWALYENKFFSGVVRIQRDRGHTVVSGGPYRFIRHPAYAAALWTYVAIPIFLDSLWAFIPAVLLMLVLIVRTALEDQTLQQELDGYKEFAQKTRYRLFPGIW